MPDRIVINTPGVRIKLEGNSIVYPAFGKPKKKLLSDIRELRIYKGVSLSSNLILEAVKNNVIVIFADDDFEDSAIVLPARGFGTIKTQREQIRAYDDHRGTELLKTFTKASIITRARLLRRLADIKRGNIEEELRKAAKDIEQYAEKVDRINGHVDEIRNKAMQEEMAAGAIYYKKLALVIPEEYEYEGKRTKRPPENVVDALISYLRSRVRDVVLEAVILAGLHPYFGFLHADIPRRMSMVLDLAEEFLIPIADAIAIKLLMKRKIQEEDYREVELENKKGIYLDIEGRIKVEEEFLKVLRKGIRIWGTNTTIEGAIFSRARALAAYIKKQEEQYKLRLLPPQI